MTFPKPWSIVAEQKDKLFAFLADTAIPSWPFFSEDAKFRFIALPAQPALNGLNEVPTASS